LKNNIKINKSLVSLVSRDRQWIKALSVFYSMKYLYTGGIILNISKRYCEISEKLDISESNLRSKVKFLIKEGLVKKESNNLIFIGFNKIKERFKIKTHKSFKISYKNPKELEVYLKLLVLDENLKKQEFKVQENIIKEELKKFGKIEARTTKKKIKKFLRSNIQHLTEKYKKRELDYSLNSKSNTKKLNTDVTLSRLGIARNFGRISKSTGSRFVRKIKNMGLLLQDEKRIKKIVKNTTKSIIYSLELDSSYFFYKNSLYQRKTNIITFTNILA
jgi:hypothetical protein